MTDEKIPAKRGDAVTGFQERDHDHTAQQPGSKTFATLAASFALAGHSLVRASDGGLLAIRWGMFRPLANMGEAMRFLKQIGGAQ